MSLPEPAVWRHRPSGNDREPIPPELVLRELRTLDLADPASTSAFSTKHGWIDGPDRREWRLGRLLPEADMRQTTDANITRAHLAAARALVDHWLAAEHGEPVMPAWHNFVHVHLMSEEDAYSRFADVLNDGLRWYHVRVHVPVHYFGDTYDLGEPSCDLYDAICLQLWNLIAEGVPPKACPHCGTSFVHQRDRATAGQYRSTGVTFCSKSCANSAGQKRRRQAKKVLNAGESVT